MDIRSIRGMGKAGAGLNGRNERAVSCKFYDIAVAMLSIMRCLFRPLYLRRKIYNGAEDGASGY